jgi:hypothetical protein
MSKFTVLADILHDGKRYAVGAEILVVDAKAAARLLAGGWIAVKPEYPPLEPGDPAAESSAAGNGAGMDTNQGSDDRDQESEQLAARSAEKKGKTKRTSSVIPPP